MSDESQVFEVEIRISAHGQQDAVVSREYTSSDARSTDKVARDLYEALPPIEKSRMRLVNDGG